MKIVSAWKLKHPFKQLKPHGTAGRQLETSMQGNYDRVAYMDGEVLNNVKTI